MLLRKAFKLISSEKLMQYKIHDFFYVQLLTSHESFLKSFNFLLKITLLPLRFY